MFFYIPTKIYEEENCVFNHKEELASFGHKALIVTGKHSAIANGSLKDVQMALDSQDVSYIVFNEVEENPSTQTVMKGYALSKDEDVDFVIGIGGGSPMDAAKAIAFMLAHEDADESILYSKDADDISFPVCMIPTTCGTGSEVTGVSVLSQPELNKKGSIPHKIYPDLALIDFTYLKSASFEIICDTSIDALGHMWESYLNTKATDYSRLFVNEGLRIWKNNLPYLRSEKKLDDFGYRNLMNASTLAGMAIAHTGTAIPHALSYPVTVNMHVKHGKAAGMFLSGYLKEASKEDRDHLLHLSGFDSIDEFDALYDQICHRVVLPEDLKKNMVKELINTKGKLATCPYPLNEKILYRIIER